MMHENLMSLTDAARKLPHRPHTSTLWRWHRKGCNGIRLEAVKIGGRVFTSAEALQRFTEKLTERGDRSESVEVVKPRSLRQREAAISRAEDDLRQGGW